MLWMLGGYSAGYEFVLDGMTTMSFFEYTSENGQGTIPEYTLLKPIAETLVARYLTKFIVRFPLQLEGSVEISGDHERECICI